MQRGKPKINDRPIDPTLGKHIARHTHNNQYYDIYGRDDVYILVSDDYTVTVPKDKLADMLAGVMGESKL